MTRPYNTIRWIGQIHPGFLTIQIGGYCAFTHVECSAADALTEEDRIALARAISREIESAYRAGWRHALDEASKELDRARYSDDDEQPDLYGIEPRMITLDSTCEETANGGCGWPQLCETCRILAPIREEEQTQ